MNANIFNRLAGAIEKELTRAGKQRINEVFQPYRTITLKNNDSEEVRKIIVKYNSKVKDYNRTGEELALLLIHKIDQLKPQPQDNLLGAIDEMLRLRSLKKDKGAFRMVNSRLHLLERRMSQLQTGTEGIETLHSLIAKSRIAKQQKP